MTANRASFPHAIRHFATPPLFKPEDGITIIEPTGNEAGFWAGACSALMDSDTGKFYLYYRMRQPRPVRGGHCFIAESDDGVRFRTIWHATREDFDSTSIEKSSLLKTPDGKWRLYISYVDPADGRWRTDVMQADRPDSFTPGARQKVFTAADIPAEGVKDPYAFLLAGRWYLLLSYAPTPGVLSDEERTEMHATSDVYNTGIAKSSSGIAVSSDGVEFEWLGDVFAPRDRGWDSYASRLGSMLYMPPAFIGFYDGSADVSENYEERTGLAVSLDLRTWDRVTTDGPALISPHASGSLRYLDPVDLGGEVYYYYEYARADGSHELRLNQVAK